MNILNEFFGLIKSMFQWWVLITPWQQGVRVRLGKNVLILEPGIHLKIPIVDIVYVQPIRIRVIPISDQCLMTSDGKIIVLAGSFAYTIKDLLMLYQTLHSPSEAIEQKVMGLISECVFDSTLVDLSPKHLMDTVNSQVDLTEYGLETKGFFLTSFASVRTYRLITGEVRQYPVFEEKLNTSMAVGSEK